MSLFVARVINNREVIEIRSKKKKRKKRKRKKEKGVERVEKEEGLKLLKLSQRALHTVVAGVRLNKDLICKVSWVNFAPWRSREAGKRARRRQLPSLSYPPSN